MRTYYIFLCYSVLNTSRTTSTYYSCIDLLNQNQSKVENFFEIIEVSQMTCSHLLINLCKKLLQTLKLFYFSIKLLSYEINNIFYVRICAVHKVSYIKLQHDQKWGERLQISSKTCSCQVSIQAYARVKIVLGSVFL